MPVNPDPTTNFETPIDMAAPEAAAPIQVIPDAKPAETVTQPETTQETTPVDDFSAFDEFEGEDFDDFDDVDDADDFAEFDDIDAEDYEDYEDMDDFSEFAEFDEGGEFDDFEEEDFVKHTTKDMPVIPEEDMDISESMGIGFSQGVLFGFADEVSGGFAKLADAVYGVTEGDEELRAQGFKLPETDTYKDARDKYRGRTAKSLEDNKGTTIASMILGGITSSLGIGKLATAGGVGAVTSVQGLATLGAIEGAVTGLGQSDAELSDGGTTESRIQAVEDVFMGGVIGGATGGTLAATGKFIKGKWAARKAAKAEAIEENNLLKLDIEDEAMQTIKNNADDIEVMSHYQLDPKFASQKTRVASFKAFMANKGDDVVLDEDVAKRLEGLKRSDEPTLDIGLDEAPTGSTHSTLNELDPMYTLSKQLEKEGKAGAADDIAAYIQVEKERAGYMAWLQRSAEQSKKGADRVKIKMTPDERMVSEKALRANGMVGKETYALYKQFQAMEAAAEEAIKRVQGVDDSLMSSIMRPMEDLRYVFQRMDERTGLSVEQYGDDLAVAVSARKKHIVDRLDPIDKLVSVTKKAKLTTREVGEALENPTFRESLPADQQKVVQQWREQFDLNVQDAKDLGLNVNTRKDYIKHQVLQPVELIQAVRDKSKLVENLQVPDEFQMLVFDAKKFWEAVKKSAKTDNPLPVPTAEQRAVAKELREYVDGLGKVTGKSYEDMVDVNRGTQLLRDNKAMTGMSKKLRQGYESGATFARKGRLPEYMREKDVEKLLFSNLGDITKAGYLAKPLKYLEAHIPVLDKMDLPEASQYLRTYVSDMSGISRGMLGKAQDRGVQYQLWAQGLSNGGIAKNLSKDMAVAAPKLLEMATNSAYSNMLGLNPRLVLRNYTQPFLMTAADMQNGQMSPSRNAYSYNMARKATQSALGKQVKSGKNYFKILGDELEEAGFPQPDSVSRDLDLHESIRQGWIGATSKQVEKVNKLATSLYSHSDIQNRWVTMKMADTLVDDLLAGGKHAKDIVDGLPRSYRRMVKRGNEKEIRKKLRQYYIQSTQLTYGKVAMSEFGRGMGSIFNMFAKWPTAVTSEVLAKFKRMDGEAALKMLGQKYLAPLAGLMAAGKLYEDELTPRGELILPSKRRGLGSIAPVHSIPSIFDVGHGPMIQTGKQSAEMMSKIGSGKASMKEVGGFMGGLIEMYTPYGLYTKGKKITETLATGKKPKKAKKSTKERREARQSARESKWGK